KLKKCNTDRKCRWQNLHSHLHPPWSYRQCERLLQCTYHRSCRSRGRSRCQTRGRSRLSSAGELVPETVDGEDVLRRFGIRLDLLSQSSDVDVDCPRQRHVVVSPHLGEQLVARQRRAAVLDEMSQQLELARRQIQRLPAACDLDPAEVDDNVTEAIR